MEKPITIRRAECIDGICSAINAARLPAFVVVEILERILTNANQLMEQQYHHDIETYREAQNENNKSSGQQ